MTSADLLTFCGGAIECSPLAMAVTRGEAHEHCYVNAAFCALTDTAGEQLLGRPFADAFPQSHTDGSLALLDRVWRTGRADRIAEVEHRRRWGGTVFWSFAAWPVLDEAHRPLALILEVRDVTALLELEETKEQFATLVSHDLRAPLSAILGYSELLAGFYEMEHQNEQARAATAIMRSARQMSTMVDELLESTRLESGKFVLHMRPEDLKSVVLDTVGSIGSPKVQSRIRVDVGEAIPQVSIDSGRVSRALMNLLINALKYSPPDTPVTVRVRRRGDEAIVSVTDLGGGISPDELPRLFERFFRAPGVADMDGLGLGLYIARVMIEAHRGRIWVVSQPGRGSIFSFALPLR